MTIEEAKKIFLNRGFIEVDGGEIYNGEKWRQACLIISSWLKQEPKMRNDINSVLEDIKAEIKGWYWQADKQAIAKDPCVVDAMIDLFIRTINKYKVESEEV